MKLFKMQDTQTNYMCVGVFYEEYYMCVFCGEYMMYIDREIVCKFFININFFNVKIVCMYIFCYE